MLKLLHFSDAHIDIATQGRHDPQSGLPVRVLDFLKALDTIVDAAVQERVDLVIFAGDAYKDRTPAPTFQREWGKRIIRLSQANILTLLLVGNHDLPPASGRAHALQEYDTLQVPHVRVLAVPQKLSPAELEGLPVQVLALPWISRSGMLAALGLSAEKPQELYQLIETRLGELVDTWLESIDPDLPVILTAHASVQGACYGGERTVMLGGDLALPGSLVRNPRLDYVALGHIHKPQDLNEGAHPPVIYPGSIERVDFGEAADEKYYIRADIERGKTRVEWRRLDGRRFIDRYVRVTAPEGMRSQVSAALPAANEIKDAMLRLTVEYPYDWEALLDEAALRRQAADAFEFHLVRRPQREARLRLPADHGVSTYAPIDLLDVYWKSLNTSLDESQELQKIARDVIGAAMGGKESLSKNSLV